MLHHKDMWLLTILGFLVGVSLSFSLRDYPVLRFTVMLCLVGMFCFLIERGEL